MNNINNLFFELIRVAIGNAVCLSHTPSADEWGKLYALAKKQSLVGICFAGVQRLQGQRQAPNSWGSPEGEQLYLQWMGMAAKIQQRNEVVNRKCADLQKRLSAAGMRSSILKGQGIAALYQVQKRGDSTAGTAPAVENEEILANLRQSGDIDVYVDCGREKAIEYAKTLQNEVDWDYKHLHLNVFKNPSTGSEGPIEVEMHYRPEVLMNLRKNVRLQRWFEENRELMFVKQGNLVVPSVEFNLFYILLHIYRHFFFEGVGMRQLMDYYFVLRTQVNYERLRVKDELLRLLKEFGMEKFARGIMWIMQEVFEGGKSLYSHPSSFNLAIEPDEKEGRFILNEVMEGGNFGYHDNRNTIDVTGKKGSVLRIFKHNIHLLTHYPADSLWALAYFVWHYLWKRLRIVMKYM